MLTWDEEIKPTSPSLNARGSSGGHAVALHVTVTDIRVAPMRLVVNASPAINN